MYNIHVAPQHTHAAAAQSAFAAWLLRRPKPQPNLSFSRLAYDFTTEHKQHDGLGAGAFAIKVNRKATGEPIFDTTKHRCGGRVCYVM
jgi:hypothetical protein